MVSVTATVTHFVTVCLVGMALWRLQETAAAPHAGRESHVLQKRNAWWSKKSAGFGDGNGFLDEESQKNLPVLVDVACYAEECVPDLLMCANQASTEQSYAHCKLQHRLCVSKCFHGSL